MNNNIFDEVLGHTPTVEEIQAIFEKMDEGVIDQGENIRRVTYPDWMVGTAASLMPNILAEAMQSNSTIEPVVKAICIGMLIGAKAHELGWDTGLIVLDKTMTKTELKEAHELSDKIRGTLDWGTDESR